MQQQTKDLILRTLEIDFLYNHRHLPGTLAALPVIHKIYQYMTPDDVFILSGGHTCAALYAVLESRGLKPNVANIHPERDYANGVTCTTGSLGHGLPMAVGIAFARQLAVRPGTVRVLIGDGESAEGSNYEALLLAETFKLRHLEVHMTKNGHGCLGAVPSNAPHSIWTVAIGLGVKFSVYTTIKGNGVPSIEGTADHVFVYDQQKYEAMRQEVINNQRLK